MILSRSVRAFQGPLLALAVLLPGAAFAQGAKVTSAIELAHAAETLKPGQWVWAPQIAPKGPVTVYVDLSRQLATVYRNGVRIGVSTVSSGKDGYETPTGVFTILQKDADHRSNKYNSAPMPYQQRLTWDGVALHAGGLPGYPESHGCVHLPMGFAKALFAVTPMGGTVIVAGEAGKGATMTEAAGIMGPEPNAAGHTPLPPGEDFRWEPQLSPTGPLTIIASRADGRAVVLRNGKEIGRARVTLPVTDFETHVLTYAGKAADGQDRWIYVGVPGHAGEDGKLLDPKVMAEAVMPAAFEADVRAILAPGSTILVTQAPILPDTTGKSMTVMTAEAP
ncbi:MAG: L,D-transpeptidase [Caulobacter sp.]|nr:L,D-transpeptidase [Caulobacter sp.]